MRTVSMETPTHGRVVVRDAAGPRATLVGFHGYMENADIQMERLLSVPGVDDCLLVSVQGLHRFYKGRSQDTIASWMTRQDREQLIADNIEYASRVIEQIAAPDAPLYTVGFSQGAAMAFRAGVRARRLADGIIAVGGDVPPELLADAATIFPRVLLVRGERDEWYTEEKMSVDAAKLRERGAAVEEVTCPCAHEWTQEAATAAASFIRT